ncbi:MAG: SDR family oxidoreductase [Nitriliruptorales bacterium]|nr:SDR family oxidoreductase [Nitriliruptorales bacterium]
MDRRIRRALVTGASAGIGEEFARQLARRGVDVVLVARREGELETLAKELATERDVDTEVLTADLTVAADLQAVEERLRDRRERPVDLLVNNAGFGAYGDFHELPLDRQQTMVELNITAVVRLTHAVLPGLRERGRGGVINVASTAAFQPDPYGAVYGGTKAFVHSFTQALHEELRGSGVRAMSLCPGYTRTEFQEVADVSHGVPELAVLHPDDVVSGALRDFTRGRATSIPGAIHWLEARAAEVSPQSISRKLSGLVHERWARG